MTGRTPGPWIAAAYPTATPEAAVELLADIALANVEKGDFVPRIAKVEVERGDDTLTVAVTGCGPDGERNAAFIVTACNSHDALVEALRAALAQFDAAIRGNRPPLHPTKEYAPKLRAALALVDGAA